MSNIWAGQGVFSHNKKDYTFGDELPAEISKSAILSLRKKGLVVDKLVPVAAVRNEQDKIIADLTAKLKAADRKIGEMTATRKATNKFAAAPRPKDKK